MLGVLVLAAAAVRLLLGDFTVSLPDFLRILGGAEIPGATYIITGSRLPRVAVAVMVGAALGVAGTIFQTMLRNPLASPDIIGVSQGASAAAVAAIVLAGAAGPVVSLAALAGALVVALVMHLLSRSASLGGDRFVLVGIGVAAIAQAAINFLLTRADLRTAQDALLWLMGSLGPATADRAAQLGVALAVLLPLTALLARRLSVLELGHEVAAGLGVRVRPAVLGLTVVAVALTASATAAAGPVAFVAFLAGPIARRLLGGRPSLLLGALTGALIVLVADHVAAEVLPVSLPVGVVTGATGAPFLLWLLAAKNRGGRSQ
ncbi:iron chelate uptake ABC transporter family permease subunit [Georgenia sp. 10Sc9-8]|uniref:Iron chelate uptake ABC transporter family permease subunit n=1 Tax=Georgenia halotolerans TaxID=3028317 RepID=A0ABT5TZC3_9MICO|nr:iron chelate uptake ABC transporter family permease subunit [Georgenia halotolerans]